MTQILRTRRSDISLLLWSYGNQRQLNYYEILRVPQNSSQKAIKQAFVKLSKEMHPDTSGTESHSDFVKLNEAYTVLSKEATRRQYDESLKYYGTAYSSPYSNVHYRRYHENVYTSRREWEARMSGGPWPPPKFHAPSNDGLYLCLAIMVIGLIVQVILINKSFVFKRKRLLERSKQLEEEYRKIRAAALSRTTKEQFDIIRLKHEAYQQKIKELW